MTLNMNIDKNLDVMGKVAELYSELINHDGYGDLRLEVRILKRGQKEIIIFCGKQYRFVVNDTDARETARSLVRCFSNGGERTAVGTL